MAVAVVDIMTAAAISSSSSSSIIVNIIIEIIELKTYVIMINIAIIIGSRAHLKKLAVTIEGRQLARLGNFRQTIAANGRCVFEMFKMGTSISGGSIENGHDHVGQLANEFRKGVHPLQMPSEGKGKRFCDQD
jgi:hypothetical protein